MKKAATFLSIPLIALGLSACTHSARDLPPGHYEHKTSSVDAYGTGHDSETSTDVYYDANGDKKAVIERKSSTDPQGLFNKSTSESTTIEQ
jgi:hypothetical protein